MWADQQAGRKRRNPVHGEEEIRFILNDTFEWMEEEGEGTYQEGGIEMEDPRKHLKPHIYEPYMKQAFTYPAQDEAGTLFESSLPALAGGCNDDSLLAALGDTAVSENPQHAVTGGGSFKLLASLRFLPSMHSSMCRGSVLTLARAKPFATSIRITYPSIQQNSSAYSLLPSFIEVAGKKWDNTELVLDRLEVKL